MRGDLAGRGTSFTSAVKGLKIKTLMFIFVLKILTLKILK
jgi:hypothetical protein